MGKMGRVEGPRSGAGNEWLGAFASMPQRRRRASVRAGGGSRAETFRSPGACQMIDRPLSLPPGHTKVLVLDLDYEGVICFSHDPVPFN